MACQQPSDSKSYSPPSWFAFHCLSVQLDLLRLRLEQGSSSLVRVEPIWQLLGQAKHLAKIRAVKSFPLYWELGPDTPALESVKAREPVARLIQLALEPERIARDL
jgi:hypothetical protein